MNMNDSLPLKSQQSDGAAEMLGFVSRMANETLLADLRQMICKNQMRELDGYIFALSRITKHELAWDCISKAFADEKSTIPSKFYPLFGKQRGEEKPKNRMEAQ